MPLESFLSFKTLENENITKEARDSMSSWEADFSASYFRFLWDFDFYAGDRPPAVWITDLDKCHIFCGLMFLQGTFNKYPLCTRQCSREQRHCSQEDGVPTLKEPHPREKQTCEERNCGLLR